MGLPRKWVLLDKQGRITIPKYLLDAIDIDRTDTENAPLLIEAYPTLKEATCLFIKKE